MSVDGEYISFESSYEFNGLFFFFIIWHSGGCIAIYHSSLGLGSIERKVGRYSSVSRSQKLEVPFHSCLPNYSRL